MLESMGWGWRANSSCEWAGKHGHRVSFLTPAFVFRLFLKLVFRLHIDGRTNGGLLMNDHFDLERFVTAQHPVYDRVLKELRAGRKTSHWMWYVFPQLRGLGWTPTARHYGIASMDEARAYLAHPVLGSRLLECVGLVLTLRGPTAGQIFGYPDVLKFRSCLTLFSTAAPEVEVFPAALARYYGGEADALTLERLSRA
jgi:uncharacterized protein (DUF1810 family)